jgi:hypothetical protein
VTRLREFVLGKIPKKAPKRSMFTFFYSRMRVFFIIFSPQLIMVAPYLFKMYLWNRKIAEIELMGYLGWLERPPKSSAVKSEL